MSVACFARAMMQGYGAFGLARAYQRYGRYILHICRGARETPTHLQRLNVPRGLLASKSQSPRQRVVIQAQIYGRRGSLFLPILTFKFGQYNAVRHHFSNIKDIFFKNYKFLYFRGLFDRHRFSQIAGLVDIRAFEYSHMISQHLHRNGI